MTEPESIEKAVTPPPLKAAPAPSGLLGTSLNVSTLQTFFKVTGGSSLYCFSAVLVAYGIIMVLRPVLEQSDTLKDALPSLFVLQLYELALFGVLLLIVFKKVVDDAVSLVLLVSLFMVGTAMALGVVADRAIASALYLGLAGIAIVIFKLFALRRFVRLSFGAWAIAAIAGLMAYNYLAPALMARSVSMDAVDETARRGFWFLLYAWMLAAAVVFWMQAVRGQTTGLPKGPFLHSPVMACLLGAVFVGGSGVHQYAMAYAFSLERVLMDYVPAVAMVCLLVIEIFRRIDKKFDISGAILACVPLVMTFYAIYHKSVLSSAAFGFGWLGYPPAVLAATALLLVFLAVTQRRSILWLPIAGYVIGTMATFNFTPEYPHRLNLMAAGTVLVAGLLIYGLIRRNPYIALAGVLMAAAAVPASGKFFEVLRGWQLTEFGTMTGIFGLGVIFLAVIFTDTFHRYIRLFGAFCLALFIYDFLPAEIHSKYLAAAAGVAVISILLSVSTRDFLSIAVLAVPLFLRSFVAAGQFAYWRHVALGFALLIAGALVSLLKRRSKDAAVSPPEQADAPEQLSA
jgi:hypothetical protein